MVDEEQGILDVYEPAPLHESDSGPDGIPVAPVISHQAALEGLEVLCLFRLQNRHGIYKKANWWMLLYIERNGILRACSDPYSNTAQSAMGRPICQWEATAGWAGPYTNGANDRPIEGMGPAHSPICI